MSLPQRLPFLVAAGFVALLVWLTAQMLLVNRLPEALQEPSAKERPESLVFNVSLPPIAAFAHYYGNKKDEWAPYNPFIPPDKRLIEIALQNNPVVEPIVTTTPRVRGPKKDPPTPPPIAPLNLAAKQLPEVIGGISQSSEPYVLALHNDQLEVMGIGQAIGNWSLVRIEDNSAWFIPLDGGTELRVPIGMAAGSTAMEVTSPMIDMMPPNELGPDSGLPSAGPSGTAPISLRDPRVRQLLEDNPELVDRIRRNPSQVEDLIRQALQEKGR